MAQRTRTSVTDDPTVPPEPLSPEPANAVQLIGRVSAAPEERELPSGDVILTFRLVVARAASARATRAGTVDTIDCVVWKPALQRRVRAWTGGETVRVEGALRRRFWRGPAGASSRTEVEADRVRLC